MSSFIVEDKTINRIITGLYFFSENSDKKYIVKPLIDSKFDYDLEDIGGRQVLGIELLAMNYKAVESRYNSSDPRPPFRLSSEICNSYQILKSLSCFLYQCMEGDVPETDLYKMMSKIRDNICYYIATNSKEYNSSDWG